MIYLTQVIAWALIWATVGLYVRDRIEQHERGQR